MNPFTNRRTGEWLRLCADLEHADPGERFEEDFEAVFEPDIEADFEDDKREPELSHPRYIEQFLDEEYDDER